MKFLVGKRADINSKDSDGVSETTYTALTCHVVSWLLLWFLFLHQLTPLHMAAEKGRCEQILGTTPEASELKCWHCSQTRRSLQTLWQVCTDKWWLLNLSGRMMLTKGNRSNKQHYLHCNHVVTPSLSWLLISASLSTRAFTVCIWNSLTATCRGVCCGRVVETMFKTVLYATWFRNLDTIVYQITVVTVYNSQYFWCWTCLCSWIMKYYHKFWTLKANKHSH